ncbi:MAG: trypsin-like serine protease [Fulvimarina manganoxydans]|uniref:trypsin-like serine peptidase n=1 Tax=Fulvimarina manganoxydans TaxID=937218 RepID=UPI00235204E6|nr:trypsin-like serine protease [Fulvimarina manganoxydans]MCK5933084.1 trypsin-like serine protease [Fulvimarina manganoxydans]
MVHAPFALFPYAARLWLTRLPVVVALASAAASGAAAADRRPVDIDAPPFQAVGQVNTEAYGRCTGVLVAPKIAMTAAHCVYNQRTKRFLPPSSVHFVLGYDRGSYDFATVAEDVRIDQTYDPANPLRSIDRDWAILTLKDAAPASIRPASIAADIGGADLPCISAGFARERPYQLSVAADCTIVGRSGTTLTAAGDIVQGYSGGPLFSADTQALIGLQVAAGERDGQRLFLAVGASAWRDYVAEMGTKSSKAGQ